MQGKNNGEEENRGHNCSLPSHFWSTSRSPFSTFYIPFQISGSQESNDSNHVQFGAEMKKDMAFGRQLHQAEGQFRTVRNWNSNVRNVKLDSSCVVVVKPACEVDFATCELRFQRAKIGYFCRLFFF